MTHARHRTDPSRRKTALPSCSFCTLAKVPGRAAKWPSCARSCLRPHTDAPAAPVSISGNVTQDCDIEKDLAQKRQL